MNTQQIALLLKDFYNVTGQRIGVFDSSLRLIGAYPEKCCDFCEAVRRSEEGYRGCMKSDLTLLKAASRGNTVRTRCHAGLLEICAPIRDDTSVIGYLMFGQILYDTDEVDTVLPKLTKRFFTLDELDSLLPSVRRISRDYLSSVENIMTACISYIHLNRMLSEERSDTFGQITQYIDRNFTRSFTLSEMANDLNVSISTVCKAIRTASGTTFSELLAKKRISEATALLKTTSLHVNEVAALVGIADYNYFTKLFKKHVGKTPSAYRKSLVK